MRKEIKTFDPRTYVNKNTIKTHFNETIEWDEQDELMYRYFKYSLRNSLSPVMKEYEIPKDKIYEFLDRLPETCTIGLGYYPEMLLTYDNYLFMFETDYEDFIIDLFSEFPTTTSFFKVSNKLFIFAHVLKKFMKNTESQNTVEDWYIPLIMVELSKKGIIKEKTRGIIGYSKGKGF